MEICFTHVSVLCVVSYFSVHADAIIFLKFILFLNFSDPRLRAQRKQVGSHADLQRKLLGGNTDLYFPEMDVDFRTMLHELPMSLR